MPERVDVGKDFEEIVAKELGFIISRVNPKFEYNGKGRSNIRKMGYSKTEDFVPNDKSTFHKYDLVNPIPTPNFNKIEVKRDINKGLRYGILYSEPLPCVKNWSQLPTVFESFGGSEELIIEIKAEYGGYYNCKKNSDEAGEEFYKDRMRQLVKDNQFIINNFNNKLEKVSVNFGDEYIKKMTSTNDGLYTSHGFYRHNELIYDFRTKKSNFCGTIRREIFVKLRQ